jgi:phosphotransferase system enzyme I (PtsI)
VQYTLGLDRERPEAALDAAADPAVLASIARVAAAGRAAGLAVEVCGEAAGEPHLAALFVGLGVTELSITPTRLDDVRAAVRSLTASDAERTAQAALECGSAREAAALGAALLRQARHDAGELPHGRRGVVA